MNAPAFANAPAGKPTRPVLRWHGGKWKLAPWIISHFPAHRVYVEPFGGAASVLLRKERARSEIYNDLDGDCFNLFKVLREQPDDLARALALTPYARDEYDEAYAPCRDPVDAARRFVARSFMGFSSKGAQRPNGFDARINDDHFIGRLTSLAAIPFEIAAIAGRLIHVMVERRDACEILGRYDTCKTLFYVDPPYLPTTRYEPKVYVHELDRGGHTRLLDALRSLTGMVVLSGYPSELYDAALSDWRRVETAAHADGARPRTEVLWLNPSCAQALDRERSEFKQLHLLESEPAHVGP